MSLKQFEEIIYDHIESWKGEGAYEFRKKGARNKALAKLAANSHIEAPPPQKIGRGITLSNRHVEDYIKNFRPGKVTNLKFAQGFSADPSIYSEFSEAGGGATSVVITREPSDSGKIGGMFIDVHNKDFVSDFPDLLCPSSQIYTAGFDFLSFGLNSLSIEYLFEMLSQFQFS